VSVVTPVYNAEPYLAECIESVLAQTYPHWEYVIVDNCSTDGSLALARRYAQRDPRVRVQANETFLKQFQNWNHALRQMAPDSAYCKVVHADDWLFPECLERMVAVGEAQPSAGLIGAYRLDETRVGLDGLDYPSPLTAGRVLGRRYLLENFNVFGSPSSLLLRAELVRREPAFYDETILHADTDACLRLLQSSDFGFVHQVLTFTRRHNESVTSLTHQFRTLRVAHLQLLLRYGRVFLTEAEYQQRLQRLLDNYYHFLAGSVLELRGRTFWDFHRRELEAMGYPLQRSRLARAVGRALLHWPTAWRHLSRARTQRARPAGGQPPAAASSVLGTILSRER
jgi:glycosyltransferase involved in cell wall biosynthesis